jgi:hypothetical protein
MMKKYLTHTLMALGGGLGVFLLDVSTINPNPYVQSACFAGVAVLTGLGVGVAKRN